MAANYTFRPDLVNEIYSSYSNGNLDAANKFIAIPHADLSEQILTCSRSTSSATLRIWKLGTSSFFQTSGTLGVSYFSRSTTVTGLPSAFSNYHSIATAPGATQNDDLLILAVSSGTAANNQLHILRRVSDADPFPGSSTIDNINRWNTLSANIGNTGNLRDICYVPHPTTLENDLLLIAYNSANFQLIRRTAGNPFPGATTADNIDRWQRTRATYTGGDNTIMGVGFIKHPTTASQDLIVAVDVTNSIWNFIERGSDDSDPFPGTNRYTLELANIPGVSSIGTTRISAVSAIYNPENGEADYICLGSELSAAAIFVPRGSLNNADAFKAENAIVYNTGSGYRGSTHFVDSDRKNDFAIIGRSDNSYSSAYPWQVSFQPKSDTIFLNLAYEETPVLVNSNGIVLSSSQAIYNFDRYASGLSDLWGRDYWTRNTESDFVLDANLEFTGTAALTGNYSLEISGTVTLGSRTSYNEPLTITATGKLVLNKDVAIAESFVLSAGTTVEADDLTGPYTLTIPYADPGLVLGTGITIASPVVEYSRGVSGAPAGSAIAIFKRISSLKADRSQFTLAAGNDFGDGTLVIAETIPNDTPSSGFIRVLRDDGTEDRLAFSSWEGSTFTLTGTIPATYSSGNGCYVGYIDVLGSSTGNESIDLEYVANRNCVLVVRLGSGSTRIREIRQDITLTNQDQVIPVSGFLDTINTTS